MDARGARFGPIFSESRLRWCCAAGASSVVSCSFIVIWCCQLPVFRGGGFAEHDSFAGLSQSKFNRMISAFILPGPSCYTRLTQNLSPQAQHAESRGKDSSTGPCVHGCTLVVTCRRSVVA